MIIILLFPFSIGFAPHRFDSAHPGYVFVRQFADSPEEPFNLLKGDAHPPEALPAERVPNGLSAARQWYLHNQIRPFCTDETKDTTCPRPTVPVPPRNNPPPPRNPPQVQTPATPEERPVPATAGRRRLYDTSRTVDDEPPAQMPRMTDGSRGRRGRARGGRGGNRGRGRGHSRDDGHF